MIYKILTGCYIVAALVLVAACNDGLDIQTKYPFTVETMPVPKELKVNETAEIRCELKREGRWEDTRYTIRWFLFDGEGTLKLDDGTVLLPNDRYPLEKETFRLYYTPLSDEQSGFTVWVEDSDGQAVELEFDFNADNDKEDGYWNGMIWFYTSTYRNFPKPCMSRSGGRTLSFHKRGTIYVRKTCCRRKRSPCWRRFPPGRSGKT